MTRPIVQIVIVAAVLYDVATMLCGVVNFSRPAGTPGFAPTIVSTAATQPETQPITLTVTNHLSSTDGKTWSVTGSMVSQP